MLGCDGCDGAVHVLLYGMLYCEVCPDMLRCMIVCDVCDVAVRVLLCGMLC